MTLTVAKKWFCDYRDCEAEKMEEKIGQRGESPAIYSEIPQYSDWVKTTFSGRGKSEYLHFCCQDCMEKELNLLTQQGIEAPANRRSIEAAAR